MVLLMLFALVAGAGTALSPCVLPVLPAVLGAGVTGGRRRPLGVVTGLAVSFTFATVALVYVIDALGLPDDIARTIAIVVLIVFGVSLIVPAISDRIEAWSSRFSRGPQSAAGEGFGSGLVLGASLGLLYAPCAGPILAGVITVSAAQDFTGGRLAVALSYAIGSAAVLYALLLGGRRLAERLRPIRAQIQVAMGALMLCVAALMATDLDTRFQTAIAEDLPSFLVNPTGDLEESEAAQAGLSEVRGSPHGVGAEEAGAGELDRDLPLPALGAAPEFTDTQGWFNTPDGEPLSLSELDGRVVLIDFWTYTCINCIRTLPHVTAWDRQYRDAGLTVVGVHTPEFPFERDAGNVEDAVADNGIEYPVAQDNEFGTWNAYGNQYWPAKYLIDAGGQVRYVHFGEGKYEETEAAIRTLLREAGSGDLGAGARAKAEKPAPGVTTPETYLGAARAQGFVGGPLSTGANDFGRRRSALLPDQFAYGGRWLIGADEATAARRATIDVDFGAEKVFLVLGSADGRPRSLRVMLDGRRIPNRFAGDDVRGAAVTVSDHRLYRLVDLPGAGRHRLRLSFEAGISGYAFTFG